MERAWEVIGRDGKIVFVRHGKTNVRVSTCRLVKVIDEFRQPCTTQNTPEAVAQKNSSVFQHNVSDSEEYCGLNESTTEHQEISPSCSPSISSQAQQTHILVNMQNSLKVKDRVRYLPVGSEACREATVICRVVNPVVKTGDGSIYARTKSRH